MAEVFISYAREDRERARDLADALTARGWEVWWDRSLYHGDDFEREIERQLASAGCVLVLWSEHAAESTWVRNEARFAADRGVLIPVLIDDVPLPVAHSNMHYAQLVDWSPDRESEELEHLNASIARTVGRIAAPSAAPPPPPPAPSPREVTANKLPGLLVAGAVVIGIGVGVFKMCSGREPAVVPPVVDRSKKIQRTPPAERLPAHYANAAKAMGTLTHDGRPRCAAFRISPATALSAFACADPAQLLHFETMNGRRVPVEDVERDEQKGYALLQFPDPRTGSYIPKRLRAARAGENVAIIQPSPAVIVCTVRSVTAREIRYDCPPGESQVGAPVMSADGLHLLGMNVAADRAIPIAIFERDVQKSWSLTAPAR